MSLTDYTLQSMLQGPFGAVAYTSPTDTYLALSQTTPTQAKGTSGAPWNFTEPSAQTTLTTALVSGTAYTSLAVEALDQAVASGDSIVLTSGANTQTFVTSAAAAVGATSLAVTSLAANFAYPVGTLVQDSTTAPAYARVAMVNNTTNWAPAGTQPASGFATENGVAESFPASTGAWGTVTYGGVFDAPGGGNLLGYVLLRASSGTLSTATGTSSVTSLATTALTIAVASGATVRLTSGVNTQEFTTSAAAAVGATSIAVVSQVPDYNFPVGSEVLVPNPLTIAASTTPSFAAGALFFVAQ
jgi:hypothetical protein